MKNKGDSLPVALAMYRFWAKMVELNGPDGNLPWLHKAHREVVRVLKAMSHNVVKIKKNGSMRKDMLKNG